MPVHFPFLQLGRTVPVVRPGGLAGALGWLLRDGLRAHPCSSPVRVPRTAPVRARPGSSESEEPLRARLLESTLTQVATGG
ncbi:hypothetical protein GCM10009560_42880 [Nonomuraea longicatena]|uniref:Secreted protein n=1 Tax=Nonomuraea longicatena TaxID=83682 RepID=A0ABP4ADI8_9ACTN